MSKTALVVPIYIPSDLCLPFLSKFKEEDFDIFLVIDDGSSEQYKPVFDQIAEQTVFEVIGYEKNRGKGYALKHGFHHILDKDDDVALIVTADGDGQHAYEDIIKVRDASLAHPDSLVLGSRTFDKKTTPIASRIGNWLSREAIKVTTNEGLKDTQTGLRGIPASLFELALSTSGNRYDYESDFLSEALKVAPCEQVDIQCIYINNNDESHFRPVADTILIHKRALVFIGASLLAWAIDLGLFYVFARFVFTAGVEQQVFASSAIARMIAGTIFFLFAYFLVVQRKEAFKNRLWVYAIIFLVDFGLSACLVYAFKFLPIEMVLTKLIVDAVICVVTCIVKKFIK